MIKDYTRRDFREDVSNQYPQNIYRAVFGVMEPTTVPQIGALAGDRGGLEFAMILANLSDREADIIRLRYQKNKTLEEAANIHEIGRERVRQIEAKALRRMRKPVVQRLLLMGASGWLKDLVESEANRIAEERIPREVSKQISERLEWARERMMEREAEELALALNGEPDADPKVILAENITVEEMELSVRSYNCLKRAGYNTVADIIAKTYDELKIIRNLGKKSLEEIIQKVNELGFDIKDPEVP